MIKMNKEDKLLEFIRLNSNLMSEYRLVHKFSKNKYRYQTAREMFFHTFKEFNIFVEKHIKNVTKS